MEWKTTAKLGEDWEWQRALRQSKAVLARPGTPSLNRSGQTHQKHESGEE